MNQQLFDMHCHLGFFEDPVLAAQELAQAGVSALCVTVEPAEFERLSASVFAAQENVHLAVGLHPWWLTDGRCAKADIKRVTELASAHQFIGEIGLDFGHGQKAHSESEFEALCDLQIEALETIFEACSNGGHVLSIHAVNAAGEVLDLLEHHNVLENNKIIFHWFSGSGYELTRAMRSGCYFSVGARMLESKRGRAYAQQIPLAQLLLETDMPESPVAKPGDSLSCLPNTGVRFSDATPTELAEELSSALVQIAELRSCDPSGLSAQFAQTSQTLLGL